MSFHPAVFLHFCSSAGMKTKRLYFASNINTQGGGGVDLWRISCFPVPFDLMIALQSTFEQGLPQGYKGLIVISLGGLLD